MPKEESFPIPLKYIDVTRTSLDVLLEKQIEGHWNVDGERKLSDAWTGFTSFVLLKERPPEGFSWSGERLTRNKQPLVLTVCGQICGNLCPMQQKKKAKDKVESSDASSNALQHTDKEQWRDPPQKKETQDTICLCCRCRREQITSMRKG